MILRAALAVLAVVCLGQAQNRTQNIVLITSDGLRWQELFGGPDPLLLDKAGAAKQHLAKASPEESRAALMPFFWKQLAPRGIVLGNVKKNSSVQVTNGIRVSYPGYSEILTGRSQDSVIRNNDKIQNPTQTVLEFLKERLKLQQRQVALFGSWDTFRFIGESHPGSIVINAGTEKADGSPVMRDLSMLQNQALTPWDSVRHDYVTLNMALDYMRREKPRVIYIALGETDDWAHDRRYDRVLSAIQYFDEALRQIFELIDSSSFYKNKTSVVISSDHGRGSTVENWHGHGDKYPGAEQIWIAMAGAGIAAKGEMTNSPAAFQRDIAPTILSLLGIDPQEYKGATGKPIPVL